MHPIMNRTASERGAVLVQAAIVLLVLLAFTTFVFDHGVLWVARNQAQTAADAGALAGAIGLAYDDTTWQDGVGPTVNPDLIKISAARAALCASGSSGCTSTEWAANPNPVWQAQSGASAAVDVLFECPAGFSGHCLRVNVYRNGEGNGFIPGPSSMLPTFFGPLLGIQSQGVKATASARVAAANGTNCLRPFAIPDFFADNDGHEGFDLGGVPADTYTPPTSNDPGTGYQLQYDVGTELILKDHTQISSGNFRLMDLFPDNGGGTSQASDVIQACTPAEWAIGEQLQKKAGNSAGIKDAMKSIYQLDPGAYWDGSKIANSCVDRHDCQRYSWDSSGNLTGPVLDSAATISPRLLVLPVYDPQIEAQALADTGKDNLRIVNFVGFFYSYPYPDEQNPTEYHGIIVSGGSGLVTSGSGTVSLDSAFLKVIQLIR